MHIFKTPKTIRLRLRNSDSMRHVVTSVTRLECDTIDAYSRLSVIMPRKINFGGYLKDTKYRHCSVQ